MKSNRRLAVSGSALSSAASPIACTMRTRSSMSMPAAHVAGGLRTCEELGAGTTHRLAGGRLAGAGVEHGEHRLRREPPAGRRLRELSP